MKAHGRVRGLVASRAIIAGIALLLGACAADVRIQHSRPPGVVVRIAPTDRLYVMRPADGDYRGKIYPGSGDELLAALVDAFATHTSAANVLTAESREADLATSLDRARTAGAAYLLQPAILRWEERTEWSGKQDRVRLRLTFYEVASGQPVDAAYINIESPELETNEQSIGALLRDPLVRFAGGLF